MAWAGISLRGAGTRAAEGGGGTFTDVGNRGFWPEVSGATGTPGM